MLCLKSNFFAFLAILIWSSAFIIIKILLQTYDAFTISVFRFFLTGLILLVYIVLKNMKFPKKKDIILFIISGINGFVLHVLFLNIGLNLISPGVASIINSTSPIITSILSIYFFQEKLNKKAWIFIFISFLGILILSVYKDNKISFNIGIIWVLFASINLSIYNITQKKLTNKYTAIESVIFSIFFASIIWIILSPTTILKFHSLNMKFFILILYLTIIVGIISYFLWSKALSLCRKTGEITIFIFLTPLFSIIMEIIIFKKSFNLIDLFASLLILIGIFGFQKSEILINT